ncbi:MAG: M3 family metallopeptidase [Alistipes sp.]|nr:M3 family metallopeptidase [Alistipes sp.]
MKRIFLLFFAMFSLMMNYSCKSDVVVSSDNPLIGEWTSDKNIPPFDQIRAEHYEPAFEEAMKMHNDEINAIVRSSEEPTFENVILALDNAGIKLSDVNLLFGMISASDLDEKMQEVQNKMMPRIDEHYNAIMLNDSLFMRVKAVYDQRAELKLDELQMRLLDKTYNKFVRSGALLEGEKKERLKQINSELSMLTIRFGNNLLAENANFFLELNAEQVADLPESVRKQAEEAAKSMGKEGYVFTLDKPSMLPFLTYSKNRDLRRQLYDGYLMRGNNNNDKDNKEIVKQMTELRIEKAHLLGYKSYSHYVTADQMAGTPKAVYELLDEIWEPSLKSAKAELEEMKKLFEKDHPKEKFERSDWWYYAEQVRKDKYQLDEDAVRQYLSFDNVRNGMFQLANRLYGITFRPIVAPRYHPECTTYEVIDVDDTHLGVLYLDPYPRKTKSGGAWCGYFSEQRYENGKRRAPVVGIVCNFTPPVGDTPSLLTFDEAETLFHEFGHALHFLFADVKYRGLAEVEGDFVELPSQIMENWAFEPEILKTYATHYRSGEVIPDRLIQKIEKASLFNQGFITTELAAAALIDMDIHSLESMPKDFDVVKFEDKNLAARRGLFPEIAPRYRYTYFAHIFNGGYSSGYYFYLWAEVLDKDAFAAFAERRDICDKELAKSFRYDVLAQGGQRPGMDMYIKFRGAAPDKKPMLRARGLWTDPEPVDTLQTPAPEMPEKSLRPEPGNRPVPKFEGKANAKKTMGTAKKPADVKRPIRPEPIKPISKENPNK